MQQNLVFISYRTLITAVFLHSRLITADINTCNQNISTSKGCSNISTPLEFKCNTSKIGNETLCTGPLAQVTFLQKEYSIATEKPLKIFVAILGDVAVDVHVNISKEATKNVRYVLNSAQLLFHPPKDHIKSVTVTTRKESSWGNITLTLNPQPKAVASKLIGATTIRIIQDKDNSENIFTAHVIIGIAAGGLVGFILGSIVTCCVQCCCKGKDDKSERVPSQLSGSQSNVFHNIQPLTAQDVCPESLSDTQEQYTEPTPDLRGASHKYQSLKFGEDRALSQYVYAVPQHNRLQQVAGAHQNKALTTEIEMDRKQHSRNPRESTSSGTYVDVAR